MAEISDHDLRAELGATAAPKPVASRTARDERVIAGFEDIQRFAAEHGRAPRHGEERDIFERLYAVRLDRIRASSEMRELLTEFDSGGLLAASGVAEPDTAFALDDASLLADLGASVSPAADITQLRHVRSREDVRAAEEIASQTRCADFTRFRPLFEQTEADLLSGLREARRFQSDGGIRLGEFFILGGQTAYVAEVGEEIRAPNGESDARLRVIYANGTESNLLRRSLQRALYKDETGRRITDPVAGPLFGSEAADDDRESGTIYVLRSLSDDPRVVELGPSMHKIGVTGGRVEDRVRGAADDPTFLFADVEIVASWKLFNIKRARLETLIHRVFAAARFDLAFKDRWGRPVRPREWFLAPLTAIDEAVQRISDGTITDYVYEPAIAALRRIDA